MRSDGAGFEIVFGHRRVRAARFADLVSAPCMVRDMTDAQSRSAQVAENLQRADVHPLEEAEGFMSMIQNDGLSPDDLAAKFGKSRTYIYNRFKLLDACPALRDAYLANEIGTEATILLARLPSAAHQEKALEYIEQDAQARLDNGGKVSFRRIHALLSERFSLDLREAIFDVADADLLSEAGSCTDCWKRSGNAPEFADIVELGSKVDGHRSSSARGGANVCTDPDCFAEKKKVHLLRVVPRAPKAAPVTSIESEPTEQKVEPVVAEGDTSHGDAREAQGSTMDSVASSGDEGQEAPRSQRPSPPARRNASRSMRTPRPPLSPLAAGSTYASAFASEPLPQSAAHSTCVWSPSSSATPSHGAIAPPLKACTTAASGTWRHASTRCIPPKSRSSFLTARSRPM